MDLGHLLIDDVTWRVCLIEIPYWFGGWGGDHSSICFSALLLVKSPRRLTIS